MDQIAREKLPMGMDQTPKRRNFIPILGEPERYWERISGDYIP
jgi:hypothetical protein